MEAIGFVTKEQYAASLRDLIHSMLRNELVSIDYKLGVFYWPERQRLSSEHWSRMFELPWCIEEAGAVSGLSCLDVGSGESPLPVFLAERGANVLSLDIRPSSHLRAVLEDRGRVVSADVTKWEPGEKFDRIFCISVIEHINCNPVVLIERMRSWLTDRGRLILTMDACLPGGDYGYPVEDCRQIAAHCGLSVPYPDVDALLTSNDFDDMARVGGDIGIFYMVLQR